MTDKISLHRRRFLQRTAVAVAAIPFASLALYPWQQAKAEKVRAEDGHAHHYVNDAADADHQGYEEGQRCDNCALWAGEKENGWGGCNHPDFQGVLVNAAGWCSAYVAG